MPRHSNRILDDALHALALLLGRLGTEGVDLLNVVRALILVWAHNQRVVCRCHAERLLQPQLRLLTNALRARGTEEDFAATTQVNDHLANIDDRLVIKGVVVESLPIHRSAVQQLGSLTKLRYRPIDVDNSNRTNVLFRPFHNAKDLKFGLPAAADKEMINADGNTASEELDDGCTNRQ